MMTVAEGTVPGLQPVAELVERSRRLIAEGRPEEGNVVAMLAVRLHPRDPAAHVHQIRTLLDLGRAPTAAEAAVAAVRAVPDDAGLRALQADVLLAMGEPAAAAQAAAEAVTLAPTDPAHADRLGTLLQGLAQFDRAALCHADAFDRAPTDPGPLCRLAVCMLHLGAPQQALDALDHAATLAGFDPAWALHRAIALHLTGRHAEAAEAVQAEIARTGGDVRAYLHLGAVFTATDRAEEAMAALDMAGLLDPGDGAVRHLSILWQDPAAIPRDPILYAEAILDPAAAAHDEHALDVRRLRTPGLIESILDEVAGPGRTFPNVLDLGCRTGLLGLVVAARAGRLVGVDPNPALLRMAAAKHVYEDLRVGDPSRIPEGSGPWDLIVAHDLSAVVGDLGPLAAAAAAALVPGGLFLFATEAAFGDAFEMHPNGRFRHGFGHVEDVAASSGLEVAALRAEQIHLDAGFWTEGWVVALRRPGG
jgi:predicted TPR repeat methyltransferase